MLSKFKIIFIACMASIIAGMAQSPSQINYQGVARNAAGTPLANQNIRIRLKIHDATAGGTVQYSEVRNLTTNANGLFNLVIGSTGATSTTGSFAAITWSGGPKFLQVEMDPTGGTTYTNMGTQQLVSTPYALHANTASTLKFPVNATDSLSSTMLTLYNKNQNAIDATSKNGIGVYGYSYNNSAIVGSNGSASSSAIYGSNTSSGTGIMGYSQNGIGVAAQNGTASWPAIQGTNNLGIGVKGNSAAATGAGVEGNNTATGAGVKGNSTNLNGIGVNGNNTAGGTGVSGISTNGTGKGVYGSSVNGTGVYGSSDNIAVAGSTLAGTGIYGNSYSGTAIYGYSATGYALNVGGKVKITGSGQNPGAGKVLTSDANGNATWEGAVAFSTYVLSSISVPQGAAVGTIVPFSSEVYDLGNNYNTATRKFTAPAYGIYHFDAQVSWDYLYDDLTSVLQLQRNRNGSIATVYSQYFSVTSNGFYGNSISTDIMLQAGDEIYVEVLQTSSSTQSLMSTSGFSHFNGRLEIKL